MPLSDAQLVEVREKTVMLIGAPGSGKTYFARKLVERLSQAGPAALLGADMGQAAVGVPTCMSVSLAPPWNRPDATWFIGDVTPVGNLVPAVVGVARLAGWARERGVRSIVLDTTGLVEGAVARVLKYHKLLAAQAERVIAIQRESELDELVALLEAAGARVERLRSSPLATDRSLGGRQTYRQNRYREHFANGRVLEFDGRRVITADWSVGRPPDAHSIGGRVVGLLDRGGYCLGLGLVESIDDDRLLVYTACDNSAAVHRLQLGRLRLDRRADYAESR